MQVPTVALLSLLEQPYGSRQSTNDWHSLSLWSTLRKQQEQITRGLYAMWPLHVIPKCSSSHHGAMSAINTTMQVTKPYREWNSIFRKTPHRERDGQSWRKEGRLRSHISTGWRERLWESSSFCKTIFILLTLKTITNYGPPRCLDTGDAACHMGLHGKHQGLSWGRAS